MRLLPLIAATFFMVSGGPYGIEDILGGAGFGWAILILLVCRWSGPAHSIHDRRAGRGHPRRGRLLHLGPPRPRAVLGLSGGLAFAHRQHLRHGALSFHLRALPGQILPCAHRGLARLLLVVGCRGHLLRWNLLGAPRVGEDSVGSLFCWWLPLPSSLSSASGRLTCTPRCTGAVAAGRGHAGLPPPSWSRCGTTWAGTTPPRWPGRSKIRSATIRAP